MVIFYVAVLFHHNGTTTRRSGRERIKGPKITLASINDSLYPDLPPTINQDLAFTYPVNGVAAILDGALIIVPEPSTITLVLFALVGLVGYGWRQRSV